MNLQNTFAIDQKTYGKMPIIKKWATRDSKDEIEPIGETILFEGIVKRISDDGKVKTFQLTKPINLKTEATQKTGEGEVSPVELDDIISVDDSPKRDIKPMPNH